MILTKYQILLKTYLKPNNPILSVCIKSFHKSSPVPAWATSKDDPSHFLSYNDKVYPPQTPDEPPRAAFVCHQRCNIKYSPLKMWYIASLVRGMTVDEAIKQLKFVVKKGAKDVRETIEEARQLAVKEHNVEFPSNLWVAESFVGKGEVIKGMRRHARARYGVIEYKHCHYFVRLEEGIPPEHYYAHKAPKAPHQQLEEWLQQIRKRKVINSI